MELTEELVARFTRSLEGSPFTKLVGLAVTSLAQDEVRTRLDFRPELERSHGIVHGGAIFSLMDVTAGAMCAIAQGGFASGITNVTVSASTQFLGIVRGQALECVARPVKLGKSISFVRVEVSSLGEPVARGDFVFKTTRATA